MTTTTEKPLTERMRADGSYLDVTAYEKAGGYQAIRKVLAGMQPQTVMDIVKEANLRGRGGAGFQTGMKWSFVPRGKDASPKYLVVNADEMEPGTFKDRMLMERDPISSSKARSSLHSPSKPTWHLFFSAENTRCPPTISPERYKRLTIDATSGKTFGFGYSLELHLHLSGGRYICGEETALLNALEGKRANPRSKPPFPVVVGLFGKPAVVNNVETLSCVPHIINKGAAWFRGLGRGKDSGTKLYGVSGKVKRPWVVGIADGNRGPRDFGRTRRGMRDGLTLRGVLPGGSSTPFIVGEHLDTPMDYTEMPKVGSRLGTGTMIVLDSETCRSA
jgi:NADH-quinone oxidoreductase subunit F